MEDKSRETSQCGYHYYSQIVEVLKGKEKRIDFLSGEIVEIGGEYLVAVKDFTGQLPSDINDPELPARDIAHLRCRVDVPRHALDMVRLTSRDGDLMVLAEGARIIPNSVKERARNGMVPWREVRAAITALMAQVSAQ